MLSKMPCQLVCLSKHIFFFETWRIVIRQFQVVWLAEDNHILKPLEASHKLRLCKSQGYDYLLPAPFHSMSIFPSLFTVLSYKYFNPFPRLCPFNHIIILRTVSKNNRNKNQHSIIQSQHFWGIFNI